MKDQQRKILRMDSPLAMNLLEGSLPMDRLRTSGLLMEILLKVNLQQENPLIEKLSTNRLLVKRLPMGTLLMCSQRVESLPMVNLF